MYWNWLWLIGPLVLLGLVLLLTRWRDPPVDVAEIQRCFVQQREHLEAQFLAAAVVNNKPRGLLWQDCEWESEIAFARDRRSGCLTALVAVTISFEAIEDTDSEALPGIGDPRTASAVFVYDGTRWQTEGQAVFNFYPAEVLERLKGQYERVAQVHGPEDLGEG